MQTISRKNRAWLPPVAALLFAGCSPAVRDVPLAGLNLNDVSTLEALKSQLPQRERVAFSTYALLHWPGSKLYCGNPIGQVGVPPRTVGDAISQTIRFEAELEATRSQTAADTGGGLKRQEEQLLIDRFEHLTLEREMLRGKAPGDKAASDRRKAIDTELEDIRRKRAQLPLAALEG